MSNTIELYPSFPVLIECSKPNECMFMLETLGKAWSCAFLCDIEYQVI